MDDYNKRHEAERLITLGYRVFPCQPNAKTPATTHGCLDATTDADQVDEWWDENPAYNIGVATDGLVVIDPDTLKDGSQNPWHTPDRAIELGIGAATATPRGGRHYWFRQPDGVELRNTTGKIADSVDTRANGGYVVVPPSALPNGEYRYLPGLELDCSPDKLPLPPGWLLDALTSRTPQPTTTPATGGIIANGSRNSTLASLAGKLRRQGISATEIESVLQLRNAAECNPPLPADEVAKIAASVARYEPAATRPPLAIDTIGTLIKDYPSLRKPVIDGIGREGEVVNIISKSKVGKSWFGYGLALSVVTGSKWLGQFWCERGKVLLIDNELHRDNLAFRIPTVANALSINASDYHDSFHVCSLRGRLRTIFELDEILNESRKGEYAVVIIDALYRMFPPEMSENDNAVMASIYNILDQYAEATGALIVIVHHASKGLQTGKDTTDIGAGAGAQSRAADSHLVLLPHEDPDAVVLNAVVRSFKPVDPIVLRWDFPLWTPAEDLDPNALKGTKTAKANEVATAKLDGKRRKVMDYLDSDDVQVTGASKTSIRDHTGISHGLGAVLDSLIADGSVRKCVIVNPHNGRPFDGWAIAKTHDSNGVAGLPDSSRIVAGLFDNPAGVEGGSAHSLKGSAPYPPSSTPSGNEQPDGFAPEDSTNNRKPNGKRKSSPKCRTRNPSKGKQTRKASA